MTTKSLTFTSSSPYFIYSNYPERFDSGNGDHYTIHATTLRSTIYTVVLYHHNHTGTTKRIGVAIRNMATTPTSSMSVQYYGGGILTGNMLENSATLGLYCENGSNGTSLRPVSNLGPNQAAFLVYNDVPSGSGVVAKFKFKPSENSYIRVFHCPTSYTANNIFSSSFTQDGESANSQDNSRLGGSGIKCIKTTTIDASLMQSNDTFNLFEYYSAGTNPDTSSQHKNNYEYEHKSNFTTSTGYNSSNYLWGNYEMTYVLNIKNAAGKTLKLKPLGYPAKIVTFNGSTNTWTKHNTISSPDYFSIPITTINATVKVILCGSNSGNFTGSFI